jgi:hypothetical protein
MTEDFTEIQIIERIIELAVPVILPYIAAAVVVILFFIYI